MRPQFIPSTLCSATYAVSAQSCTKSLLFKKELLAITLPPNSPRDWTSYNEWKKFSDERIAQMADDSLSWWKVYKDVILAVASKRLRRPGVVNDH